MPIPISKTIADKLKQFIMQEAHAQGFELVGITHPDSVQQAGSRLERAIKLNFHGTLEWMSQTLERRKNPATLWPDVRSIIMLGFNYGPDENPLIALQHKNCGVISVYARHRDYHDLIKGRLKQLAGRLVGRAKQMGYPHIEVKVFVDTAPVMEKPLAASAGLGWQGKHTNLVSRKFGSWLFLASIFTNIELEPDAPARLSCGSCQACLAACPTNAFPAPYQLDARRCISYLTIELKTQIPVEFRRAIGNRIYGCDDCLAACPWNKFAKTTQEIKLQAREELKNPVLAKLLLLDEAQFRLLFAGSPIKRIGFTAFMRNVLVACGNSGDSSLIAQILPYLDGGSNLVRGMAIWALKQLMSEGEFAHLRHHQQRAEDDAFVQAEW